jgi:hypothetical protein
VLAATIASRAVTGMRASALIATAAAISDWLARLA